MAGDRPADRSGAGAIPRVSVSENERDKTENEANRLCATPILGGAVDALRGRTSCLRRGSLSGYQALRSSFCGSHSLPLTRTYSDLCSMGQQGTLTTLLWEFRFIFVPKSFSRHCRDIAATLNGYRGPCFAALQCCISQYML